MCHIQAQILPAATTSPLSSSSFSVFLNPSVSTLADAVPRSFALMPISRATDTGGASELRLEKSTPRGDGARTLTRYFCSAHAIPSLAFAACI
jgi:hypothetical protein